MSDSSVQHQVPRWLDACAVVPRSLPSSSWVAPALVEEVVLHPSCLASGLVTSQVVQPFLVFHDKVHLQGAQAASSQSFICLYQGQLGGHAPLYSL